MIKTVLCFGLGLIISQGHSCCSGSLPPEPAHPGSVAGWKESHECGVHTIAILVLKKDEFSDNGKIGVKVDDVIAADPCSGAGTLKRTPRVKLQFYEMPLQKMVARNC